jgi:TP901 family phage tail tape measure protein
VAIVAAQLIASVSVQGAAAAAGQLASVGSAADLAHNSLANMVVAGVAVAGAALIGLGAASVSMASQFQNAMLQNVAHAGLATDQINMVSKAVLNMASVVGQSPVDLAKALYPIYSGLSAMSNQTEKAQVGLTELSDAAKSVIGTTTSVSTAAGAATSAFNALGLGSNNTSQSISRMNNLFDVMNKTVSLGNMTWATYAPTVGRLAIALNGTHTSFVQANAMLAMMTNEGFTAKQALTDITSSLSTLGVRSETVAAAAKKLGLTFDEQKFKTMDLASQLEYLKQITGGNTDELSKLMNGNKTVLATYNALQKGLGTYQGNLISLDHVQGSTAASFATASSGMTASWDKLKGAGQSLMVTLGSGLLPTFTKLINQVTPMVVGFMNWENSTHTIQNALNVLVGGIINMISVGERMASFFQHNSVAMFALKGVGIELAGVIGGILVAALVGFAVAVWAAMVPLLPFIAIGAAIALMIVGVIYAIQNWGHWMDWLSGKAGDMANKSEQAHEKMAITAIEKTQTQQNGVLLNLEKERTGVLAKLASMADGAAKTREEMRLAALNKQIDTTNGDLVQLQKEKDQHLAKIQELAAADIEARKNWYERANDALTAWVNDQDSRLGSMVGGWMSHLGTIASGDAAWWGQTIGSWMSSLGTLMSNTTSWWGQLIGGWSSDLGTLVSNTIAWFGRLPGIIMNALASAASAAFSGGSNVVSSIASGIESAIGSVISAMGDVASAIAAHLPHSPAKMGPLMQLEDMGAAISRQLALGMSKSIPTIKAGMSVMLSPLISPQAVAIPSISGGSGQASQSTQAGNGAQQPIILQIDGQAVARGLWPYLTEQLRYNVGTHF